MKLKLLTTLALFALASPALAGGFDHYDKNADGYISADEFGEKKAHKIKKLDADGDGLVSREEFDAYKAKKKAKDDTT